MITAPLLLDTKPYKVLYLAMAKKDKKISSKEKEGVGEGISKKFKQNPLLYIGSVLILLLVIVAFLGGDILSGRSAGAGELIFGYYDKAPIAWVRDNVLAQTYSNAVSYYQSQGVDFSNPRMLYDVWRQSYETALVHVAVLQLMKRSNYTVPKKTVDIQVAQLPDFRDNGRFSPALYNRLSESERLALWRRVQEDIIKRVYFDYLFYALMVSDAEAEFIGSMATPERSFRLVSFSVDDYPEEEYLVYAQENEDLFSTIHLSRISVVSEREAKQILDSIKSGTITFEDAARTQSQDEAAERGGDMGSLYVVDLANIIPNTTDRDYVINLPRGEISSIINIDNAWVFFRIENELKQADFDDAGVISKVQSHLRSYARGRMEDWAISKAREFIEEAEITSFDDAARERNLEISDFGPLPINYSGVDLFTPLQSSFSAPGFAEHDVSNLASNETFWKSAFSTQLNTPSEPLVQGSNVLVFIPTEQIDAEETAVNVTDVYKSYWVNYIAEQSVQHYFLANPRMDDRFVDTFFSQIMGY